jgi:hypothetical protein
LLAALQSPPMHCSRPDTRLVPGVSSLCAGPPVQPTEITVMVATITSFAIRGRGSIISVIYSCRRVHICKARVPIDKPHTDCSGRPVGVNAKGTTIGGIKQQRLCR